MGGMEKVAPQVAQLPERVIVIRQQFSNPNSWLPGPSQLTINFQQALDLNLSGNQAVDARQKLVELK